MCAAMESISVSESTVLTVFKGNYRYGQERSMGGEEILKLGFTSLKNCLLLIHSNPIQGFLCPQLFFEIGIAGGCLSTLCNSGCANLSKTIEWKSIRIIP